MTAPDAFAALAELPRWLHWREEKRGPKNKPTKVPYSTAGGRAATDKPATWAPRAAAEAAARGCLNGAAGGLGIVLGDLGGDQYLCGLDLDSCLDDGMPADWAAAILGTVRSYCEISPSGHGLKVFFYAATEDVRPFLDTIGAERSAWGARRGICSDSGDHGPAIEVYCAVRYFAVTRQHWPQSPARIELVDRVTLADLARLIPPPNGAADKRLGARDGAGTAGDNSRSARALGIARRWYGETAAPSVEALCEMLRAHADAEIRAWVDEKGDAAGGRELRRIWERISAQASADDDAAEIARLARLKALAYEREREAAAERLGCRISMLDRLVAAERERAGGASGAHGKPFEPADLEPWPDPVAGAALLDAIGGAIRRHVIMSAAEADAVALWVVGAHAYGAFAIFPRLFITAAERQSGKTTLLDTISQLVPRPLLAANISAAAVFRTIAMAQPTLLLDEADTYAQEAEDLRGVINSGHRADGAVIRVVGEQFEPRSFPTYAPMAIAAIGDLAATILDRSIIIRLRRRRRDERIEPLRLDRPPAALGILARQAARWVADHGAALAAADPAMPGAIVNRAADNWAPLLAIADLAGCDWPELARAAALALIAAGTAESVRVQLLAAIRDAFREKGVDLKDPEGRPSEGPRIASEALVEYLIGLEASPWPEFGRAKRPITKVQVARLLKPLGIAPGTIRLGSGATAKGYYRSAFEDAFARYLPSAEVVSQFES
jgi:putative DNA primase/helicase